MEKTKQPADKKEEVKKDTTKKQETKERFKNIYEKLNYIQTNIKCNKGQHNNFGNYNYRSCEDILEAVKPYLAETKTTLTLNDDIVLIANRFYIKATATLTDCSNGTTIQTNAYARESESKKGMDDSQITGASSSYARKYALNCLLLLDDTKDADTNEFQGKKATPQTEEDHNFIYSIDDKLKYYACKKFNVNSIDELSSEQVNYIKTSLEKKKGTQNGTNNN